MLGQLVDSDYLLDFDIFHVSHVTELLHYVDAKYLSSELGGTNNIQVDTWLNIQQNVDIFTVNATHTARKLSAFMRLLHQDDQTDFLAAAERNRNYHHQLRVELEEVTRQGVIMLDRLEEQQAGSSSTNIQREAVQRLCCQLETTWHYFTNTFKIQVRSGPVWSCVTNNQQPTTEPQIKNGIFHSRPTINNTISSRKNLS